MQDLYQNDEKEWAMKEEFEEELEKSSMFKTHLKNG